jgi:TRAP-type C4-dicarboxylate transport system permease large subunit
MDAGYVALISVIIFIVLILIELHIAIAIGVAGLVGVVLLDGWSGAIGILQTLPYTKAASYALFVIPMYVLLGALISHAKIGERIYHAVGRVVGRLPGGLGAAAVLATAVFSGISGSSAADVAAFGRVSVTEMTRHGYKKDYAAAIVAAAGAFAALIPPSITMVLYAVIANTNVEGMIVGGIVPGIASAIILAGFLVLTNLRRARRNEKLALAGVAAGELPGNVGLAVNDAISRERVKVYSARASSAGMVPGDFGKGAVATVMTAGSAYVAEPQPSFGYKLRRYFIEESPALFIALIIFLIVAGGIYSGLVTATEAGALGAFVSLIIALLTTRRGKLFFRVVWNSALETARNTAMIFLITLGGGIFSYSLVLGGTPASIAQWITDLPLPPKVVVGLMILILLPLGAFLDGLSMMLITVPLMAPVALQLGFSPIWFGILVLKMIEIGLITPPVGINIFVISGIVKEPSENIFRKVVPFIALDLAFTVVLFLFPEIILWLPNLAGIS